MTTDKILNNRQRELWKAIKHYVAQRLVDSWFSDFLNAARIRNSSIATIHSVAIDLDCAEDLNTENGFKVSRQTTSRDLKILKGRGLLRLRVGDNTTRYAMTIVPTAEVSILQAAKNQNEREGFGKAAATLQKLDVWMRNRVVVCHAALEKFANKAKTNPENALESGLYTMKAQRTLDTLSEIRALLEIGAYGSARGCVIRMRENLIRHRVTRSTNLFANAVGDAKLEADSDNYRDMKQAFDL